MKYSEIIKLNNLLDGQMNGGEYKITILSNIMIHQSKDICEYLLRTESLNAKVSLGEYDNIVQDSLKFQDANAIVLFWEACNFIDGLQFKINLFSDYKLEELIERIKLEIDIVLSALKNTPTVIINRFSSLIFDQFNLSEGNLKRLSNALNIYLESNIEENVSLFNIDGVISRISIKSATDLRYYYSSKTLYSVDFYREYFKDIQHMFFAANGKTKKALIFDCDNTLWKGTLGEDGFNGIKIYQEVQYLALQLSKKGVIIGLCSKNNPEDIDNVLENHPDIILKDSDIVIKKVNWDNKVLNLQSIAEDLDIGIDSLVFIDDSSFEIGLIKQELPAVKVFQAPAKEYEYGLMMNQVANLFYNPSETKEDGFKTQFYRDQAKRSKEKSKAVDIESYLISLGMVITVYLDNLSQVSRISQLTQKTNQFNLTTKRYTESDIKGFILDVDKIVISIEVSDKYGLSGLTGLAILCKKTSKIDTLLLSCRVLGRNIEYKFIDIIVNIARQYKFKVLEAIYTKTLKNSQVEGLYDKFGFDITRKTREVSIYLLDLRCFKNKNLKYIEVKDGKQN
jgi:FkbH-like protein